MPEYLAQTGYKNPADPNDGIFQYTKGFQGSLFDYYDQHPVEGASFNNMMGGIMAHQASWLDVYPHDQIVALSSSERVDGLDDTPLLVDVGGNVGHELERFRAVHPETAARLYLQDREPVIRVAVCPDPVHKMVYDFFTPQPIQGEPSFIPRPPALCCPPESRAHNLTVLLPNTTRRRSGLLHAWRPARLADARARAILENQRAAVRPHHSRLLIQEHVLRETAAHPHATAYDLTMMAMVAGVERTEQSWRALLGSAGFRVVKVWSTPLPAQSVIEAEAVLRPGE